MPWSYLSVTKQGTDKEIAHYRVTFQACFWKRGKVRCLSHENDFLVVRAIFVWPWNENARTKQKQQTNGNKAIWLVYRTDTNARGFWLVKRTLGWKNFMPEELSRNRFDVILQHDWSIEQCLLHIRVFFGGKMTSPFCSFNPLADKTNNKHLRKPFFKVIRKSLYANETPLHLKVRVLETRNGLFFILLVPFTLENLPRGIHKDSRTPIQICSE